MFSYFIFTFIVEFKMPFRLDIYSSYIFYKLVDEFLVSRIFSSLLSYYKIYSQSYKIK